MDLRIAANAPSQPPVQGRHLLNNSRRASSSRRPNSSLPRIKVQISTFWQDPFVGPTDASLVDRAMAGTELANSRVQINDNREKIRPDADGNYRAEPGSDGESQINAQVVTTRTLNMWENYRGSSNT